MDAPTVFSALSIANAAGRSFPDSASRAGFSKTQPTAIPDAIARRTGSAASALSISPTPPTRQAAHSRTAHPAPDFRKRSRRPFPTRSRAGRAAPHQRIPSRQRRQRGRPLIHGQRIPRRIFESAADGHSRRDRAPDRQRRGNRRRITASRPQSAALRHQKNVKRRIRTAHPFTALNGKDDTTHETHLYGQRRNNPRHAARA